MVVLIVSWVNTGQVKRTYFATWEDADAAIDKVLTRWKKPRERKSLHDRMLELPQYDPGLRGDKIPLVFEVHRMD